MPHLLEYHMDKAFPTVEKRIEQKKEAESKLEQIWNVKNLTEAYNFQKKMAYLARLQSSRSTYFPRFLKLWRDPCHMPHGPYKW